MGDRRDCPFSTADRFSSLVKEQADLIVCEIHAETTSETPSWYLT